MTLGAIIGKTSHPVLAEALANCRKGMRVVALFGFFINMLMLTSAIYMMQVYDRVLNSQSIPTLVVLTLVTMLALVVMGLLDGLRNLVFVHMGTWLDNRLSGLLFAAGVADTVRQGRDPSVQALRDLSTFRGFLTGPAIFPILDAPWAPIFMIVIFLMHPALGVFSLLGAVVLFAMALWNERATRDRLAKAGQAQNMAIQQAERAVRNADVIEAMGMLPNLVARWYRQNGVALQLQAEASIAGGRIAAASKIVRLGLQSGILGVGAYLVLRDGLSPGSMMAASILMGRALSPVEQAIGSWRSAIQARTAFQRIRQHLENAPQRGVAMKLPAPTGHLKVEALTYAHPRSVEPTLRNIAFELLPGETMGLIGPTASGKSTLARLLVGNLPPRFGHVRLDGVDVAHWEPEDLGRHLGYMPQDVELFGGTIRENIARMGEGEPDAVIAAARMAGVHDMILRLPSGYDTELGAGGATLSGGQRQRVALARAVFGEPSFLVLDEPNSSLDQLGEDALVSCIQALKSRNATVIVIAHRPSILRHVDKILVLRDGAVQMFGPRDEVIPKVTGQAVAGQLPKQADQAHG